MYGDELIRSFGSGMGLDLELDGSGSCTFSADGFSVTLTALQELDSIALTADLGEPPPEKLENLYRIMLEANHVFHATNGATLSVDGDSGHISLCSIFHCADADGDSFAKAVERFANTCEAWSKIVAQYRWRVEELRDEPGEDSLPVGDLLRV